MPQLFNALWPMARSNILHLCQMIQNHFSSPARFTAAENLQFVTHLEDIKEHSAHNQHNTTFLHVQAWGDATGISCIFPTSNNGNIRPYPPCSLVGTYYKFGHVTQSDISSQAPATQANTDYVIFCYSKLVTPRPISTGCAHARLITLDCAGAAQHPLKYTSYRLKLDRWSNF